MSFSKQKKRIISYLCQESKPGLSKPQPTCHTRRVLRCNTQATWTTVQV